MTHYITRTRIVTLNALWFVLAAVGCDPALQTKQQQPAPAPVVQAPASAPAPAAKAKPDRAERWEKDIRAFEAADRQSPPPKHAVLFIGSSSIRMWKTLATDFPEQKVINRGFGGSWILDSTRYIDRIVAPYQPRKIVLYAGGNDITAGRSPELVAADFREFVEQVRRRLPEVPIVYISIRPTPSRTAFLEKEGKTNGLIHSYIEKQNGITYVDSTTPMLTSDGKPRADIVGPDRLHMNRQGYEMWIKMVGPLIK